ncbi:hypothetical protein F2Q69_00036305 [Brassica cretica]|uniref:Uncharacterized protein n=1 Tax=Brassica cretica TaxID=69181 RepID=A0A8S9SU89_BRACR|nr:hypothetical protein F2Q69_00036305 [Brassica cretica]
MEIAGHMDVYASGALYGDCGSETYVVVVLCTESVVCGLASHTSRSNSPVTHPSFFPPFRSSFCFFPLFSSRVLLSFVFIEVFSGSVLDFGTKSDQLTSVDRIFRCLFQPVAKVRATPLNPELV